MIQVQNRDIENISKRILLHKNSVRSVLQNCKTIEDIATMNMGSKCKPLEDAVKASFINELLLRKGR